MLRSAKPTGSAEQSYKQISLTARAQFSVNIKFSTERQFHSASIEKHPDHVQDSC